MMKPLVFTVLLCVAGTSLGAQSLELGTGGYGLSIGNSTRHTGIRINAMDNGVEQVSGLNLTLWNPGKNPDARYNGINFGLIGSKARTINGIAISGIGVSASEHIGGLAAGTLGVGARNFTGVAAGLIMVDVKERTRGITIGGAWTGNENVRVDGMAVSAGGVMAGHLRGIAIGGVFAAAGKSLTGSHALYNSAEILTMMGDTERALDCLYGAYRQRNPYLIFSGVKFALDPLRGTKRFRDLMSRMGMPKVAVSPEAKLT